MNLSKTLWSLTVIFLGMTIFSGCSVNDKLNDMHDKTSEMAGTTKDVANTSRDLKTITEDTYYGLRKPTTLKTREDAWDCMVNNADMGTKLDCATAYYFAFEFQNWKNTSPDDLTELNILKDQAIEEFFERLQKFYVPGTLIETVEPLSQNMLNFYALAATLHKILGEQVIYAAHNNFTPPSMYSIIADGLRELKNNPTRDPATMPKWMFYVQKFQPFAIDLLKARLTYIPVQLYAEDVDLNKLGKVHALFRSMSDQKHWQVNLYDKNPAEIASFNEYMEYTLQTRKLLIDLGEDSNLDNSEVKTLKIQSIFKNMQIVQNQNKSDSSLARKEVEVARFRYLANLLLMSPENFSKVDPSTYNPEPLYTAYTKGT